MAASVIAGAAGCAQGSLSDALDAGALDALTSESGAPWRKPPAGEGAGPADPASPDGESPDAPLGPGDPAAPPSDKPPPGACGNIDGGGICKGAVAFWCEDGVLRTRDCRALETACAFQAAEGGFRCTPVDDLAPDPGNDPGNDPGGAPDPGDDDPGNNDPGGGEAPGGGADPNDLPPEEPELPDEPGDVPDDEPADPGEDPGGDPGGACGDIDYLGECQGDVAVWCGGAALERLDCNEYGTPCAYIDDEIGYYCLPPEGAADAGPPPVEPDPEPEPTPDLDAFVPPPPEPGSGCDLGFTGECQGDVARFCAGDTLVETDCAAQGQVCDFINDVVGYYCTDPVDAAPADDCGGVDYIGYCSGDIVVWCDAGQLFQVDCASTGEICGWISEAGGYFCTNEI